MFSALQLQHHFSTISPETVEELAIVLWKQLEQTCKKHEGKNAMENAESLKITIYAEALNSLTTIRKWKALVPLC